MLRFRLFLCVLENSPRSVGTAAVSELVVLVFHQHQQQATERHTCVFDTIEVARVDLRMWATHKHNSYLFSWPFHWIVISRLSQPLQFLTNLFIDYAILGGETAPGAFENVFYEGTAS